MNYSSWIQAVCDLLEYDAQLDDPTSATPTTNAVFNNLITNAVEYTENRLQRDLDLLNTVVTLTGTMTANQKKQTLPLNSGVAIQVCQEIAPIISGVKQAQLEFISREMMDFFWPSEASVGANVPPKQWSPNDQLSVLVGPAPDQAYSYSCVGTVRFVPMSAAAGQTSNFLSQYFGDLYLQCSMIFWYQMQRDFGAQSDDPRTAQSAENQYQMLLKSAAVEEIRKKFGNMFQSPSYPVTVEVQ